MSDQTKDIKLMEVVYGCTDCCNKVFEYGMLHHSQIKRAERLVNEGYLESRDGVEKCDGDGFSTGREGTGFRLTLKGYEALTAHNPEGYPPELRREWAKASVTR